MLVGAAAPLVESTMPLVEEEGGENLWSAMSPELTYDVLEGFCPLCHRKGDDPGGGRLAICEDEHCWARGALVCSFGVHYRVRRRE